MSNLSDFRKDFQYIIDNYHIKKATWIQFIPIDDDITYEINIISIDGKKFHELDNISRTAWELLFKLISNYSSKFLSKQFGNNVEITISKEEIVVNEYNNF